jgi:molybdopterin-guanine dinucleotide biosynthesis protein
VCVVGRYLYDVVTLAELLSFLVQDDTVLVEGFSLSDNWTLLGRQVFLTVEGLIL